MGIEKAALPEWREVAIRTATYTWHRALQNQVTDELEPVDGCTVRFTADSPIEIYPALPDWVAGIDLCKRCHHNRTDR